MRHLFVLSLLALAACERSPDPVETRSPEPAGPTAPVIAQPTPGAEPPPEREDRARLKDDQQNKRTEAAASAADGLAAGAARKIEMLMAEAELAPTREQQFAPPAPGNPASPPASVMTWPEGKMRQMEAWYQNENPLPQTQPDPGGERYQAIASSRQVAVAAEPVSTFGIDVDSASYSNVRRFLEDGQRPPRDAVRLEELVNYFDYDYAGPGAGEVFAVHQELAAAPWAPERQLLRIALQAANDVGGERPPANLVLLIDVSGSMDEPDKLPLLKSTLKLMVQQLRPIDRIGIVTYAGYAGVLLPSTSAENKDAILAAIDLLQPGGGTNGSGGIDLAYQLAQQGFQPNGINRVLLATDGDFNIGTSNTEELKQIVSSRRATGIGLSTLGFGTGNLNDHLMEVLADNGNGSYSYIDSLAEGHKVLVQQLQSTLSTVAGDVKLQVEFNPAVVQSYRLLGYENRALKREDFSNDRVDAGDVGAGHNVTALYELVLTAEAERLNPRRYGVDETAISRASTLPAELAYVRLRYKRPGSANSEERSWAVMSNQANAFLQASSSLRFATAVAGFAARLREDPELGNWSWQDIRMTAAAARGADPFGHQSAFLNLIDLASALSPPALTSNPPGLRYLR
jgi:Ca-activated chloride channel homolog